MQAYQRMKYLMEKNRWKITKDTPIPNNLALAIDTVNIGHVHIIATKRMKMSEYITLLESMFEKAEKIENIQLELIRNKEALEGKKA